MFDRDKLLTPISDAAPCGADLRMEAGDLTFQALVDFRTEVLPEDDVEGAGKVPDWVKLQRGCDEALASKTKDLEMAVWLTEGLCNTEGFPALAEGMRLVTGLLEGFWETVHPGVEEDGEILQAVRARPLSWMGNSKDFALAVSRCAIAQSRDARNLTWEDYTNSSIVDDRKRQGGDFQELVEAGYMSGEEWLGRLGTADTQVLRDTVAAVSDCEAALNELRGVCDVRFEADEAPNFVGLGGLLMDVREYVQGRLPNEVSEEAGAEGAAAQAGGRAAAGVAAGPVGSRAEALQRLSEVASFFRQTEPHSPISYLVQRTVKWGNMPLEDLLREIVQDESVLTRIWDTLGITGTSAESGSSDDGWGAATSSTESSDTSSSDDDGWS